MFMHMFMHMPSQHRRLVASRRYRHCRATIAPRSECTYMYTTPPLDGLPKAAIQHPINLTPCSSDKDRRLAVLLLRTDNVATPSIHVKAVFCPSSS
jgi:hypothetical protein